MRFEVPQFIEVEDKIFGPLTWRQFLYLGGGLGMAVVILLVFGFFVFVVLGIPLALLAAALSFYPVNNRPFSFFLEAVLNFFTNQRLYLWRQKKDVVYKQQITHTTEQRSELITGPRKAKDVASLARKLELQAIQKQQ